MSDLKLYIYLLKPTRLGMLTEGPTPAESASISRHAQRLAALAEAGAVLLAGRALVNDERTFGIVIFYAADDAAAEAFAQADPAVADGVMSAQALPYSIAFHSARLKLD